MKYLFGVTIVIGFFFHFVRFAVPTVKVAGNQQWKVKQQKHESTFHC